MGMPLEIAERVDEARIAQKLPVGKALEKGDDVLLFFGGQRETDNEFAFVRIFCPVSGQWPFLDESPAARIMVDHFFESGDGAIVHVGRGQFDVAQGGGAEPPHVGRPLSELPQTPVVQGIVARATDVVEAVVVEFRLGDRRPRMVHRLAEVEATVAVKALHPFGEEQFLAASCRRAHRIAIALKRGLVVGRIARDQNRFEGGDSLDHPIRIEGIGLARIGIGEQLLIQRIVAETIQDFGFVVAPAQLQRKFAECWDKRLRVERGEDGVGPVKRGVVDDVGQAHGVARMRFAGRADGSCPTIGEGARRLVAGSASHGLVDRHPQVVKQMAAQFDLGVG